MIRFKGITLGVTWMIDGCAGAEMRAKDSQAKRL